MPRECGLQIAHCVQDRVRPQLPFYLPSYGLDESPAIHVVIALEYRLEERQLLAYPKNVLAALRALARAVSLTRKINA
jgi:hypothetical protein